MYNFDDLDSVPTTVVGDNSILDGKVVYCVGEGKTGNAKVIANTQGTHHYLQVSAGGNIDAGTQTITVANQSTYLKVAAAQAGKEKIIFTFTTVKGGVESNNRIIIADADGTVLGESEEIACPTTDDDTEHTATIEATVPETFYIFFARSEGKGGWKFTKVEQQYPTAKASQDAPTAANFTPAVPASAGAKGTITINDISDVTTLEYATSADASSWTAVAASPVSVASGTYYFRFKETDDKKASPASPAVTVPEYVNDSLPTAEAPAPGSVTATPTTSASDNDGTLTVNTTTESRAL
ncbi:MAG: hypothetical protein IJ158_02550 [Treponema sp.]|nr:hypothetical protein [Treponema sp.]